MPDSKTYDATTASSKSPSITVGSLVAGDNATYTQTFDSKNAGTRSLLPSIVITDGNNGHNYSVIFHNANGTISPLTIAGSITVLDKTYDGTISAAIATRTLSGVLANDVVSYTGGTATFSDSNAGVGKTVTAVGLYLAGTDAGNYLVNPTATTTATISKANQQISWSTPAPIVFGTSLGNTQLNAAVTGVQGGTGPGALTYTPAAGTILGVGTRQLRVDAASTINYNPATATVSINVSYSTGACLGDMGHSILQPINADGSSTFKQGSTVPEKFRVCDVAGHSIGAAGVVTSFNLVQTITGTVSATVDEAVISTTRTLTSDGIPRLNNGFFNVSTKPLSAQTTYVYSIGLNDGSTIFFRYGLPR
jgi:YDG domain